MPNRTSRGKDKEGLREIEVISAEEWNLRQSKVKVKKGNKYHAIRTVVDDIQFDSRAEAAWYGTLKNRLDSGEIKDLEPHPRFRLYGATGLLVSTYVADFRHKDTATGMIVITDVKGRATRSSGYVKNVKMLWDQTGLMTTEVMIEQYALVHERDAFIIPKTLRTKWNGKDRTN